MFAKFLKRKSRLAAVLSAALILPFLLFPFYHFHPDSALGHPGQLQLHEHQGHFHSEVMEGLAHLTQFHPPDSNEDQPFHQSHSLPEHDPDDLGFYTHSTDVPPVKADFVSKQIGNSTLFEIPQPPVFHSFAVEILVLENLNLFSRHSQRSPPLLV